MLVAKSPLGDGAQREFMSCASGSAGGTLS
jgi:hypothetical protein